MQNEPSEEVEAQVLIWKSCKAELMHFCNSLKIQSIDLNITQVFLVSRCLFKTFFDHSSKEPDF
jgi:hypothetical protein